MNELQDAVENYLKFPNDITREKFASSALVSAHNIAGLLVRAGRISHSDRDDAAQAAALSMLTGIKSYYLERGTFFNFAWPSANFAAIAAARRNISRPIPREICQNELAIQKRPIGDAGKIKRLARASLPAAEAAAFIAIHCIGGSFKAQPGLRRRYRRGLKRLSAAAQLVAECREIF